MQQRRLINPDEIRKLLYTNAESGFLHTTYQEESQRFHYLMAGDERAIEDSVRLLNPDLQGKLSDDPIRNMKYLVERCTIFGGSFNSGGNGAENGLPWHHGRREAGIMERKPLTQREKIEKYYDTLIAQGSAGLSPDIITYLLLCIVMMILFVERCTIFGGSFNFEMTVEELFTFTEE